MPAKYCRCEQPYSRATTIINLHVGHNNTPGLWVFSSGSYDTKFSTKISGARRETDSATGSYACMTGGEGRKLDGQQEAVKYRHGLNRNPILQRTKKSPNRASLKKRKNRNEDATSPPLYLP
jgi:hypothetical protein